MPKRLCDLELKSNMKVTELVESFENISFNARKLAKAARLWTDAVNSEARIYLSLAGALVPGGLRRVIAKCIEEGIVQVVVTTGANMVHDVLQSYEAHELGDEQADDVKLKKRKMMRVYDTYIPCKDWDRLDKWLETEFYPRLVDSGKASKLTPSQIFRELGRNISHEVDNGILSTAYQKNVPIYCPAYTDCDLGIALHHANTGILRKKLIVDQISDFSKLVEDIETASQRCAVMLGGGTPKNYLLQSSISFKEKRKCGFDYAIQLTTDSPQWGGLSGATLTEAVSWGKLRNPERGVTVYSDATITFPLLVEYVLDKKGG